MDAYSIIRVGNKQHRVRHGETLIVERVATDEGATFQPEVLLGEPKVTATVLTHMRGPKILIGKYKRRTGYKRHNGFRATQSRIEIALGGAKVEKKAAKAPKAESTSKVEAVVEAPAVVEAAVAPAGLPEGYADLKVGEVAAGAKTWSKDEVAAALAYEQEHGKRKGALSALEAAASGEES
ncbi:MAG: hypothetical protein F2663_07445 [Actinobacteria bacterium]|uniref:Unannotated protein n=1 Tax=freshwater metagenome TaxID=449393 RepID=A0A6J6PXV1_9ZZZZ|nr:hypothetical protein [Actinomycetota bacterium]